MELPLPPPEMRALVGVIDPTLFDNPAGDPVISGLNDDAWDSVLDFGCGCGRVARQMIQQRRPPGRYVGVDLHPGMVRWCQTHLTPVAPQFRFVHQDIFNVSFNPTGTLQMSPFPVEDGSISLIVAWSVFTHVNEASAEFYLREVARVLRPDGVAWTTWFIFDKEQFPMMQDFQNALFINEIDPGNAVIFAKTWLQRVTAATGLVISAIEPPVIRGFHWKIQFRHVSSGASDMPFPADEARSGSAPPPLAPANASRIGLD